MKPNLNISFKFDSSLKWFNRNYFICLYDKQDNYITSFEKIEDSANFFNKPLWRILENLRRGYGIEYNHKRYKLICFKKDKEDDLDFGGKSL